MTVAYALCWRTRDRGYALPGSTRVPCSRCSVLVWLAPSSSVPGFITVPVCVVCASDEELRVAAAQPLSDEQVAELRDYFRDDR